MHLSDDSIGWIVWGSSCFLTAAALIFYDGMVQRDLRIICGLYIALLMLQPIIAGLAVINADLQLPILSACVAGLIAVAGNVAVAMSCIFILTPLHKNNILKMLVICVLPTLTIAFMILLNFVKPSRLEAAAYFYSLPCALIACGSLLVLFHWFRKEKFVFATYSYFDDTANRGKANINDVADWSLLFKMAWVGCVVALLVNGVYCLLTLHGVLDEDPRFLMRLADSLICLPLITPLIRSLDKAVEYTQYRIFQELRSRSRADVESKPLMQL